MNHIVAALDPIPAMVWGELAMGFVGVGTVYNISIYTLGESTFWRLALIPTLHLEFYKSYRRYRLRYCDRGSTLRRLSRRTLVLRFYNRSATLVTRQINARHSSEPGSMLLNLDTHSARFQFPLENRVKERVVLIPSSYTRISLISTPKSRFTHKHSVFYPDKELLLESFVTTAVREPKQNR
ncbi:hypothetical protein BJ170DRAFT_410654 [Xylariales sp. AK1849]|nr:hypothetical protein BJ170DRAFT_410654 [Xylariales sp. AK1849]